MAFQKGQSGNPKGRGKGVTNKVSVDRLLHEVHKVGLKKGKPLLQHFVERAYEDDRVLVAVIRKLVADKSDHSVNLAGGGVTLYISTNVPRRRYTDDE